MTTAKLRTEPLAPSRPPTVLEPAPVEGDALPLDIVDEWGRQSFPASDPPANW